MHGSSDTPRKETGERRLNNLQETTIQKAVRTAAREAGIRKCPAVTPYATYFLEDGQDIRTIQAVLGHYSVKITMIYASPEPRPPRPPKPPRSTLRTASRPILTPPCTALTLTRPMDGVVHSPRLQPAYAPPTQTLAHRPVPYEDPGITPNPPYAALPNCC